MRRVVLSFLLGWLTSTSFAQTELDVAERIRLRELLKVSALTEFSIQRDAALPKNPSFQIFLGFGLDFETRQYFANWIEKWNRERGAKYAQLTITEQLENADIILASFPGAETVYNTNSYYPRETNGVYEKTQIKQEFYTSIFSYILLPSETTPLHLTTIWRNSTSLKQKDRLKISLNESSPINSQLSNALAKLLKRLALR